MTEGSSSNAKSGARILSCISYEMTIFPEGNVVAFRDLSVRFTTHVSV